MFILNCYQRDRRLLVPNNTKINKKWKTHVVNVCERKGGKRTRKNTFSQLMKNDVFSIFNFF